MLMQKYSVHKIFGPTIQGEGGMTGTVCHFIRLSGCNMWDGRPETRSESTCPFCDTDFFSHTMMNSEQIITALQTLGRVEWITISGGEPALQVDEHLINMLHQAEYKVAIETNGSLPLKAQVDYVTVSPKLPPEKTVIKECDSLKLLFPHPNPEINPEVFDYIKADTKYLQPIDAENKIKSQVNLTKTLSKLYELQGWKLSIQSHKYIEVE